MFGVLDAPEYSGQTLGVYRPAIDGGKDEQLFLSHSHGMAADVMSTSSQGYGGDQVISLQVLQLHIAQTALPSFITEILCPTMLVISEQLMSNYDC